MRKISVPDEGAESLYGPFDENLKHLETLFNVRIRTSGHELLVEGEAADAGRAEKVLEQLTTLIRGGYRLGKGDVKTASQLVAQDENVELSEYFLRGAGRPTGKRQVMPKSVNQRRYLDAIEQHDIVFGIGPAGTGKTYLAMAQAVAFLCRSVSRIIWRGQRWRRSSDSCRAIFWEGQSMPQAPVNALYDAVKSSARIGCSSAGRLRSRRLRSCAAGR
jgi:phosphate starvation-inducible PhoH-like protein